MTDHLTAVTVAGLRLLPAIGVGAEDRRLDIGGAVAITGGMVLAVYAIVNGNTAGWTSLQTRTGSAPAPAVRGEPVREGA